jgi:Raf kinase inhibitor-like YbhB/YbcL family protein
MEAVMVALRKLDVSSPVFEHRGFIPFNHTIDGENINPVLEVRFFPENTKSLVLVMEDEEAPEYKGLHWLCWNIPPIHKIQEDTRLGVQGMNSYMQRKYHGPSPDEGTRRYMFKIYALDAMLKLSVKSTRTEVELAMSDHILAYGELMGLYKRLSQQLMF